MPLPLLSTFLPPWAFFKHSAAITGCAWCLPIDKTRDVTTSLALRLHMRYTRFIDMTLTHLLVYTVYAAINCFSYSYFEGINCIMCSLAQVRS